MATDGPPVLTCEASSHSAEASKPLPVTDTETLSLMAAPFTATIFSLVAPVATVPKFSVEPSAGCDMRDAGAAEALQGVVFLLPQM